MNGKRKENFGFNQRKHNGHTQDELCEDFRLKLMLIKELFLSHE